MRSTSSLAILCACLTLGSASANAVIFADPKTAKKAFQEQDYETAADHWKTLAAYGHDNAEYELARLYENGQGVEQDLTKAANLYLKAAQRGNAKAMLNLGRMHEDGRGVQKDPSQAELWYRRAANAGQTRADYFLGRLYERDVQTVPIKVKGKEQKLEVRRYEEAAQYYQNAIDGGYLRAGQKLGKFYQDGKGVQQDNIKALTYYYVAISENSTSATRRAAELEQEMSAEDIAIARQNANEIIQTPEKERRANRKKYKIRTDIKLQYLAEENLDLSTRSDETETDFVTDVKLGLFTYPTDTITTYIEGRGLWNSGDASADTDDGNSSNDDSFFELRQAWIEFDELFGDHRISTKIGRQRFREERNLWRNRDFDAARLSIDSETSSAFVAIGQNLSSYRTGTDSDFQEDDKDRLRIFGEFSHRLPTDQKIEARFFYENDHSDTENVGDIVDASDFDDEDSELFWLGGRFAGQNKINENGLVKTIGYRADAIAVAGEETVLDTDPGTNAGQRVVAAVDDRDVFGYAFDGSVDFELNIPLSPTLTFGYAYGSGDDGEGTDNAFRQTGLHGNTSLFPDDRASSTLRNYGEVLRPELSNLHVLLFGASFPVMQHSDLHFNYFNYWLDEDDVTSLRSDGINASLNGQDSHIGQALDVSLNMNWGREFDLQNPVLKNSATRFRFGGFKAGDAWGDAEDEYAFRGTAEFRIKF